MLLEMDVDTCGAELTACCHGGSMALEEVGGAGGTMGGGCEAMLAGG